MNQKQAHMLDPTIQRWLAAFDHWDRPLPMAWLPSLLGELEELVRESLARLEAQGVILRVGNMVVAPGKAWSVAVWEKDQARFQQRLPELRRAARRLARLPFVRGVLLVGEAAAGCLAPNEHYEFFILTQPGRVWLCRMLAERLSRRRRGGFQWLADAQFMSMAMLTLPVRNPYVAMEFALARELYHPRHCRKFRAANAWMDKWAHPLAPACRPVERPASRPEARTVWPLAKWGAELFWNTFWSVPREQSLLRRRFQTLSFQEQRASRAFGKQASLVYASQEKPSRQAGWLDRLRQDGNAPRHRGRTRLLLRLGNGSLSGLGLLVGHGDFLTLAGAGHPHAATPTEPLALLEAAAYWKQAGLPVRVFDATFAPGLEAFALALDQAGPVVVLLYATPGTRPAVLAMVGLCRDQRAPVMVFGPDAPGFTEGYLEAGAEAAILGDAETTVVEVWRNLRQPRIPWGDISGLYTRAGYAWRPWLGDVDKIPFPERTHLDLEAYRRAWRKQHGLAFLHAAAVRSCPLGCAWCSRPAWEAAARRRSPELVAADMKQLTAAQGADRVWLLDDLPAADSGWMLELCAALRGADAGVRFECMLHPANAGVEMLQAMGQSGCCGIWIDPGTGSSRLLARMGRAMTLEQIRAAAGMVKEAGIPLGVHVQVGHPGELPEDLAHTRKLLREIRPDRIHVFSASGFSAADAPYRRHYADPDLGRRSAELPAKAGVFLRLLRLLAIRFFAAEHGHLARRGLGSRLKLLAYRAGYHALFTLAAATAPRTAKLPAKTGAHERSTLHI